MRYFEGHEEARVVWVGCNKPPERAEIYQRTKRMGLSTVHFTSEDLRDGRLQIHLMEQEIDWVVLAGFLLKVPEPFIRSFRGQVVNIHPALLPAFGGVGMFGKRVHEAVLEARAATTGISIHWVTEVYDAGDVIFQASCSVDAGDDVDSVAEKVRKLEHQYYPRVIEGLVSKGVRPKGKS